ncbi:MAG: hypothetical protein E6R04_03535 [Spirochaetes bacterium]|nr:MAG: hypothetical protein E6R04_03535 [Spirochaetota bacterium]
MGGYRSGQFAFTARPREKNAWYVSNTDGRSWLVRLYSSTGKFMIVTNTPQRRDVAVSGELGKKIIRAVREL